MKEKGWYRYTELKHIFDECVEQLCNLDEWVEYARGNELEAEFFHVTPNGATYRVRVGIQEGDCTTAQVWCEDRDDVMLENVSGLLGDWIEQKGIECYCRMNEEDERIGCTRDSTGLDSAFGSWGEVNSMFI